MIVFKNGGDMRNPDRIVSILALLTEVWAEHPDMRLGQLLSNAAFHAGWKDRDLFYLEDSRLHVGLIKFYATSKKEEP
jgi:uncharacterized protein YihD (DUF1040 family)